jgi:putative ABC transport system permease protein
LTPSDARFAGTGAVERQVTLPLSQAVGIAYRSIRLRLSRSLVVTSGIVLAIAFLTSILSTEALHDGMRDWLSTPRRSVNPRTPPPQRLESLMKAKGVAVTPQEAAAGRLQTRWVLGLALGVAFVGILNAMLMSVTERFREIGTMKCLGALDGFIVKLFLIESVFQGVAGTAIGVALGLALSMGSTAFTFGRFAWVNVPVSRIAMGVAWCILVGIGLTAAGAVYPAWQAARMQPIEAMRADT